MLKSYLYLKTQHMNKKYNRVIPRDLFNEAKLLKCIGNLCLKIHHRQTPVEMSFEENLQPFEIALMDEGSLVLTNVQIAIKRKLYRFKTVYNSKANYPLYVEKDNCEYLVFNEDGHFSYEFIDFCKTF